MRFFSSFFFPFFWGGSTAVFLSTFVWSGKDGGRFCNGVKEYFGDVSKSFCFLFSFGKKGGMEGSECEFCVSIWSRRSMKFELEFNLDVYKGKCEWE